jgi:hypothetical protein
MCLSNEAILYVASESRIFFFSTRSILLGEQENPESITTYAADGIDSIAWAPSAPSWFAFPLF